jgi:hypothetical protein
MKRVFSMIVIAFAIMLSVANASANAVSIKTKAQQGTPVFDVHSESCTAAINVNVNSSQEAFEVIDYQFIGYDYISYLCDDADLYQYNTLELSVVENKIGFWKENRYIKRLYPVAISKYYTHYY